VKELKLGTWKTSPGSTPKAFGVGFGILPRRTLKELRLLLVR
jgi:hypothetical protein